MKPTHVTSDRVWEDFFESASNRIIELQSTEGAITWFDYGVFDAWNHTEAAMALDVIGRHDEALAAYTYLLNAQEPDGSWRCEYGSCAPVDGTIPEPKPDDLIKDTNFAAYCATGLWHHFLIGRDITFLKEAYPSVKQAMGFVLSLQSEFGDIRWAAREARSPEDDALVTGCSSIFKSLECAIRTARVVGDDGSASEWAEARKRLGDCLRSKPHRFDRSWASKRNFSMDWYYPVLTGVLAGDEARARIDQRWSEFVVDGYGCRCVTGQPWVTIAESSELAIALLRIGRRHQAKSLLDWQEKWRAPCGAYWMGYQYEARQAWPEERPAWTAAAVILASDALHGITPASTLFLQNLAA